MRKFQFVVIAALLAMACVPAAALAEFTAKSSQGKSSAIAIQIKAGGAEINCIADESENNSPGWTIEHEGKPATKGSNLEIKMKSLGECGAEAKGLKQTKVHSGECQAETKEAGEEGKVPLVIASACQVKIGTGSEICEIAINPSENKELKETTMNHTGLENESLILEFAVTDLSTAAKGGGCASDGITSAKSGRLEGATEELELLSAQPNSFFTVARVGDFAMRRRDTRTITMGYNGTGSATPSGALIAAESPTTIAGPFFKMPEKKTVAECNTMPFTNGTGCSMKLEAIASRGQGPIIYYKWTVTWMGIESQAMVATR